MVVIAGSGGGGTFVFRPTGHYIPTLVAGGGGGGGNYWMVCPEMIYKMAAVTLGQLEAMVKVVIFVEIVVGIHLPDSGSGAGYLEDGGCYDSLENIAECSCVRKGVDLLVRDLRVEMVLQIAMVALVVVELVVIFLGEGVALLGVEWHLTRWREAAGQ